MFQSTPVRRWIVYVLPSALIPPLALVGISVARSGTGVFAVVVFVEAG